MSSRTDNDIFDDIIPTGDFSEANFQGKYLESLVWRCKNKFHDDLERLSRFVEGNNIAAIDFFARTIYEVSLYKPINLVASLTDSKSIHFKIYNGVDLESFLEVFYSKEDEEDHIEAVLTVYLNEQEIVKSFGTLDQVMSQYRMAIGQENLLFTDVEADVLSY